MSSSEKVVYTSRVRIKRQRGPVRLAYPPAIYLVMNRGDRREAIFTEDADRQRVLMGDPFVTPLGCAHDHHYWVGRSDVSASVRAEHGKHVIAGCQVRRGEPGRR